MTAVVTLPAREGFSQGDTLPVDRFPAVQLDGSQVAEREETGVRDKGRRDGRDVLVQVLVRVPGDGRNPSLPVAGLPSSVAPSRLRKG
jgi:hypothetical protein